MKKKKIAFVLAGGGAKGAFQAGVLKSLEKKGVKPDVIYGTSIGSINGAVFAHVGADNLLDMWKKLTNFKKFASFNWSSLWNSSSGFYNLNKLRSKLNKLFKNKAKCEVVVTKIDLDNGLLKYGRTGEVDFLDSVIASASIPIVFETVNGYVDGALREKVPLKKAIQEGATEIHVILTSPMLNYPTNNIAKGSSIQLAKVAARSLDIMNHEIFLADIKKCVSYNPKPNKQTIDLKIYAPVTALMDTLEFDKDKINEAIKQGINIVDQSRWVE